MEEHSVVPDVIDTVPPELIEVKYGDLSVNLGNELTPAEVKDIPTVTWEAEDGAYYLLCMTDPDAPVRANPVFGQVRHWLVGNIPGNKIEQGETFTEYVGAGPPKDTGLHRYIFLVYKQPEKINYREPHINSKTRRTRLNFSIKTFAQKYNLGNPLAGGIEIRLELIPSISTAISMMTSSESQEPHQIIVTHDIRLPIPCEDELWWQASARK